MADKRDLPADEFPSNPWPLVVVLVVLGAGLVLLGIGRWRSASLVIASSAALAALLRLVLRARIAGLLVVRGRWVDVVGLSAMAAGIATLALLVPPSR
ncbi:MAG: DUF3017 domain-containing protein [Propionibacteriaceae bacterium]|nr:DUF3017 domain-containing protein [Propionibacteriaceae bacterium]